MTHSTPDTSVIICAYTEERWNDLVAAVESVQQQTHPPREIIVVIDHNRALLERTRERFTNIVVTEYTEAKGLSGARNNGIKVAQGAVVAFLDDDAQATPQWLEQLMTGYKDPSVIGVGGAIKPWWLSGQPRWFPEEFYWVVGCTYRGLPECTALVRNLIGANMSFRREVFQTVGGFQTGIGRVGTLPLGCEETELCIRIRQYCPQHVLRYDPQARVYHRVPPNRARWGYFRSRCYAEGYSKARVSQLVGAGDGLASERTYTFQTLPQGVLRGLACTLQGDVVGLARAVAIVAGLAITTAGYVKGMLAGQAAYPLATDRAVGGSQNFL